MPHASHFRPFHAGNVSCNLITDHSMQEMAHASRYRSFHAGNASCISLQTIFHAGNVSCIWKKVRILGRPMPHASHYKPFHKGNVSCNLISDHSMQEMSHAFHYRPFHAGNVSCISLQTNLDQHWLTSNWLMELTVSLCAGNVSFKLITDHSVQEMLWELSPETIPCKKMQLDVGNEPYLSKW